MSESFQSSAALIAELFEQIGVAAWFGSPGSRNAPLLLALQETDIPHEMVLDERSAAHMALGVAIATKRPAAVICTSGTAALNYGPAIAEAFYQRVPLLVITADRPPHLIDQGHGQSIRQQKLFDSHLRGKAHLELHDGSYDTVQLNSTRLREAVLNLTYGPVHINVPFDEPLYGRPTLPQGFQGSYHVPIVSHEVGRERMPEFLSQVRRKMLIFGQDRPLGAVIQGLEMLHDQGWVIVAEPLANVPKQFTVSLEEILNSGHELQQPDVVVTMGGAWMAKKAKAFLRGVPHLSVSPVAPHPDMFGNRRGVWPFTPQVIVPLLAAYNLAPPDEKWTNSYYRAKVRKRVNKGMTDLWIHHQMAKQDWTGWDIHWGNSMSVRYGSLMSSWGHYDEARHYGNRGVSGIDGSTSTAVGAAWISERPTLLMTGELSALYDLNGLLHRGVPPNFKTLIFNNSGGQIFRVIDGPKMTQDWPKYFEHQHQWTFEHAAKHVGVNYLAVTSTDDVAAALERLRMAPSALVVEVFTDPQASETAWRRRHE